MIAEAAIKCAKKGLKVEATIKISSDLNLSVATVVGTRIGVLGEVKSEAGPRQ